MPSRIDEAGHTKAFDYPVAEHWGGEVKERNGPWWYWNPQVLTPMSPKSNALPLTLPRLPLKSPVTLKGYYSGSIPTLGICQVRIKHKDRETDTIVQVVLSE